MTVQHIADSHDLIRVRGARENNLQDVSIELGGQEADPACASLTSIVRETRPIGAWARGSSL